MAVPLPPLNLASSSSAGGGTVYTGAINNGTGIGTKDVLLYAVIGLVFMVVYSRIK